MAKRTVVHLVDDLTGEELAPDAGETVQFGLDGAAYQIDLGPKSAAALRDQLAKYVNAGRRTSRNRRRVTSNAEVDPKAVRAWAASNGVQVSGRGRIPAAVREQYRAAGN